MRYGTRMIMYLFFLENVFDTIFFDILYLCMCVFLREKSILKNLYVQKSHQRTCYITCQQICPCTVSLHSMYHTRIRNRSLSLDAILINNTLKILIISTNFQRINLLHVSKYHKCNIFGAINLKKLLCHTHL